MKSAREGLMFAGASILNISETSSLAGKGVNESLTFIIRIVMQELIQSSVNPKLQEGNAHPLIEPHWSPQTDPLKKIRPYQEFGIR